MSQPDGVPQSPPVPIHAALTRAGTILAVTFDQPLQPASLDRRNWYGNANNQEFQMLFMDSTGSTAVGRPLFGAPTIAPDVVSYDPPPFDVMNLVGAPAAAFYGFPLQVHG